MPKISPADTADKLIRNLSNATADIARGVDAVTENPMEKAANSSEKWLQGVQQSQSKYERGCRRVSLQDWKAAFKEKGIPRIASGITAARQDLIDFYEEFFPFLDTVSAEVQRMPNLTLEDSIARMTTQVRRTAEFTRTR